jgi:hypothetical protein
VSPYFLIAKHRGKPYANVTDDCTVGCPHFVEADVGEEYDEDGSLLYGGQTDSLNPCFSKVHLHLNHRLYGDFTVQTSLSVLFLPIKSD